MEIKSVKNKILDKLNVERVMTEDEVKEELALMRSRKVAIGLTVGCTTLAIIKYSGNLHYFFVIFPVLLHICIL